MAIPISVLTATSKAARAAAANMRVSPVTVTRAVNDTVREGVGNLIPSRAIIDGLKGSEQAFKTGKLPRAGSNARGFYDDVLHNIDFLHGKSKNPGDSSWSSPSFALPKVPKGTVKASVARKRSASRKAGPKGGMR